MADCADDLVVSKASCRDAAPGDFYCYSNGNGNGKCSSTLFTQGAAACPSGTQVRPTTRCESWEACCVRNIEIYVLASEA